MLCFELPEARLVLLLVAITNAHGVFVAGHTTGDTPITSFGHRFLQALIGGLDRILVNLVQPLSFLTVRRVSPFEAGIAANSRAGGGNGKNSPEMFGGTNSRCL